MTIVPITTLQVTPRERGQTIAALLKHRLELSWTQARRLVEESRVRINGQTCRDSVRRLQADQRVTIETDSPTKARPALRPKPKPAAPAKPKSPPPMLPRPALVHLDDHIVVVEKPPGLTTMRHAKEAAEFGARAKRFLPATLAELLPPLIGAPGKLRAVHRLDRDTSGLVVFARTAEAETNLGQQFRTHAIERKYLALVRGRPTPGRIESWLVADRGDGRRGSSATPGKGQRAVTHVRIVEELGRFTLVECRLETGRTHQVRIHLGEAGAPLCGETVYDRPIHGAPIPDDSGALRLALHAASLGLHHPATEQWMEWDSPLPEDMAGLLKRLRQ